MLLCYSLVLRYLSLYWKLHYDNDDHKHGLTHVFYSGYVISIKVYNNKLFSFHQKKKRKKNRQIKAFLNENF